MKHVRKMIKREQHVIYRGKYVSEGALSEYKTQDGMAYGQKITNRQMKKLSFSYCLGESHAAPHLWFNIFDYIHTPYHLVVCHVHTIINPGLIFHNADTMLLLHYCIYHNF